MQSCEQVTLGEEIENRLPHAWFKAGAVASIPERGDGFSPGMINVEVI